MWTDLDVMRLHVEAEFRHDSAGDLVETNEPTTAAAPRFFFGQSMQGHIIRFRRDVTISRRRQLRDAAIRHAGDASEGDTLDRPLDALPFAEILAQDAPVQHASVGLVFRFPDSLPRSEGTRPFRDAADAALLHPALAAWAPDIHLSPPLVAAIVDGQAVAVCASVRITPTACEAGVETAAPFRGRGYGRAVVAAWALAVRARKVEPIYSTTWGNDASRALARSLHLPPIGRDLHIA